MWDKTQRDIDRYSSRDRGRTPKKRRIQARTAPRRDIWESHCVETENGVRQRRGRKKTGIVFWLVGVPFFLCLGLAVPHVAKRALDSGLFRGESPVLTQMEIETDGALPESRIEEAAGVIPGSPLPDADIAEIRHRIESLSRVEKTVTELLPGGILSIRVKERVPVAWLSCPDQQIEPLREDGFLLDRFGVVFHAEKVSGELRILPSIEVTGLARPVEGRPIQSGRLQQALILIRASDVFFAGRGMDLLDVRVLGNWGLRCRYSSDLLVTFDLSRIEGGLRDLDMILQRTRESGFPLATVNLVAAKNIPITFHSNINPENWQNSTATTGKSRVKNNNEFQEKHLRSILREG